MAACADIGENDGVEYVVNAAEVTEESYEYLQQLWITLLGRRLQWMSELDPAPPFIRPVWIGWEKRGDGWHPPGDVQRGN